MLHKLEKSGLPIYFNPDNQMLSLEAPLIYLGHAYKYLSQMEQLFQCQNDIDPNTKIYDTYRGISYPEDIRLLKQSDFQYDITVVRSGTIHGEAKKTSGHYHCWNPMRTSTYPEVYEVLYGTAFYVMQRADNFDTEEYKNLHVTDLIVARVEAGQSIIIPPNYAHCSVNGGNSAMIFSNLAYKSCTVDYEPVKYYHGLGVYIKKEKNHIEFQPNQHYQNLPEVQYAVPKENPDLGILFGKPVYQSFTENPSAFDFLGNQDPYIQQIMDMLEYQSYDQINSIE
ncbi:MAG TPA: hypothetical protein H9696_02145 [Candidatus Anaerostipes avicola]|nr:glucose-6-phosphate isomerase family protein [uncultured Anaerostipes sp.]HJC81982.1 hypothetical protein [Candidatus Anaerostipes avicola]